MKAHPARYQYNTSLNDSDSPPTLPPYPPTYPNPYPTPPNRPQKTDFFNRKVTLAPWLLILLIIAGIGFGYAIGYSGASTGQIVSNSNDTGQNLSSTNNVSQDVSTPIDVPTPVPTQPVGPAKIGNTISDNWIDCTLISVKYLSDDGIYTPKTGNEFIVVHVKLVNNSDADFEYNEYDFHARSSSGDVTDPEIQPDTYTANDLLNYGKLSPGGTVTGDIILEAPRGDHQAELSWQPFFNSSSTDNLWYLGL